MAKIRSRWVNLHPDELSHRAIAFWDGSIYQPTEIYCTAEAALKVGIDCIKVVIGRE
jgi:hypothetical protein